MMTRRHVIAATAAVAAAAPVAAQTPAQSAGLKIARAGSQAPRRGSPQNFTGSVRVDMPFQASAPARVSGASVTFEVGARTAWHTHPLGQTLIVTAGTGWVQSIDGPKEEIRVGDVVWIPPGLKHWHGATTSAGMTHIAISEALDGRTVDWLEQVSKKDYES